MTTDRGPELERYMKNINERIKYLENLNNNRAHIEEKLRKEILELRRELELQARDYEDKIINLVTCNLSEDEKSWKDRYEQLLQDITVKVNQQLISTETFKNYLDRLQEEYTGKKVKELLNTRIIDIHLPDCDYLSNRVFNILKNEGIVYIGDLIKYTRAEILKLPNFGRKSLNDVDRILAKLKLELPQ